MHVASLLFDILCASNANENQSNKQYFSHYSYLPHRPFIVSCQLSAGSEMDLVSIIRWSRFHELIECIFTRFSSMNGNLFGEYKIKSA